MPFCKFNGQEWESITAEEKDLVPEEERTKVIYLDGYLKNKLDYAKSKLKNDWDVVGIIDGDVGVGKSTLGFVIGWYLMDAKLTMDHICIGSDEFIERIEKFPKGSTIILDESSLSLGSTDFMRQKFKVLMNIFDVCRQQNHCLILIAPEFFRLARAIAVNRSKFLIHCYEKNGKRGQFMYFGAKKKRQLFELGKKNFGSYSKPQSNFRGRFTNFTPFPEYKEKKKDQSFKEVLKSHRTKPLTKNDLKFELYKDIREKNPTMNKQEICKLLKIDRSVIWAREKKENGGNLKGEVINYID